jgi:hypothetical protein
MGIGGTEGRRISGKVSVAAVALVALVGFALPSSVGATATKWTERAVPVEHDFTGKSVSCSGTGCVVVASACSPGGCGGLLPASALYSTNGGRSWKAVAFPSNYGDVNSVSCGSDVLCVATVTKGPLGPHTTSALAVTKDGGSSWTFIDEAKYDLSASACGSATSCFAVGSLVGGSTSFTSDSIVSTNGGKSWAQFAFPARKADIDAATCASATDCIAVGENSSYTGAVVYLSKNVGKSWSPAAVPTGTDEISAVSCNGVDCVALNGTQVLISKNGGKSWTLHSLPSGRDFESGSCFTATVCMIVGSSNGYPGSPAIEVTSNGGASWSPQAVPHYDGSLHGISCVTGSCIATGTRETFVGSTPTAEYPLVLAY